MGLPVPPTWQNLSPVGERDQGRHSPKVLYYLECYNNSVADSFWGRGLWQLFVDMKNVVRPASRRGWPKVLNFSECYNGWGADPFGDSGGTQGQ